jgi:hypothetical protein
LCFSWLTLSLTFINSLPKIHPMLKTITPTFKIKTIPYRGLLSRLWRDKNLTNATLGMSIFASDLHRNGRLRGMRINRKCPFSLEIIQKPIKIT